MSEKLEDPEKENVPGAISEKYIQRGKDFFILENEEAGKTIDLGIEDSNTIAYIISGEIKIELKKEDVTIKKEDVLCISKVHAPYKGRTLSPSTIILFKAEKLVPYADIITLRVLTKDHPLKIKEIEILHANRLISTFFDNLLLYKENKISCNCIFTIKLQELIFILKRTYPKEEVIRFFLATLSGYSDFRINVLTNFTNKASVKSLAKDCFMTTKTFTNHFKEEFGVTPYKWIIYQKIKNLNNFIRHNGTSLEKILEEFDFTSVYDLYKFCTRHKLNNLLKTLKTK